MQPVRDVIIFFFSHLETLNGLILKKQLAEICKKTDRELFVDEKDIFAILKNQNNDFSILIKVSINNFLQKHRGVSIKKDEIVTKLQKLQYNATLQEICIFISENLNL